MEMTTSAKYESWNTEDFDGKTAFMFRKVAMSIGTFILLEGYLSIMLILNTLQIYVLYVYFCVCVKIVGYRNRNFAKLF